MKTLRDAKVGETVRVVRLRGEGAVTLGAAKGAVGLPVDTWSLENWTVAEYEEMFAKIVSGEIAIDNDYTKVASTDHVTLNVVE